jgi:V/A-type H+-transporting ATPase subunit C
MPEELYTYAVARIRSKELSLLDSNFMEQLMAAKSYEECLRLLADKGWGEEGHKDMEKLLAAEREKAWSLIAEMVEDMSIFDVFLYANDYHNLKTAIKLEYREMEDESLFIKQGTIEHALIIEAIKTHNFSLLPEPMRAPAQEAQEVLLHTHDGQLCDRIIDKAALEAVYRAGKEQKNELLRQYSELTVAAANIKIAVRAQNTGKSLEWIQLALAHCDSLDVEKLAQAAVDSFEALCGYLKHTEYADAVEELETSLAAFERWYDNRLIKLIQPHKYNPFTIAPLAAYLLARENEIKTVRIILLGKLNQLPEDSIRERIRNMYV